MRRTSASFDSNHVIKHQQLQLNIPTSNPWQVTVTSAEAGGGTTTEVQHLVCFIGDGTGHECGPFPVVVSRAQGNSIGESVGLALRHSPLHHLFSGSQFHVGECEIRICQQARSSTFTVDLSASVGRVCLDMAVVSTALKRHFRSRGVIRKLEVVLVDLPNQCPTSIPVLVERTSQSTADVVCVSPDEARTLVRVEMFRRGESGLENMPVTGCADCFPRGQDSTVFSRSAKPGWCDSHSPAHHATRKLFPAFKPGETSLVTVASGNWPGLLVEVVLPKELATGTVCDFALADLKDPCFVNYCRSSRNCDDGMWLVTHAALRGASALNGQFIDDKIVFAGLVFLEREVKLFLHFPCDVPSEIQLEIRWMTPLVETPPPDQAQIPNFKLDFERHRGSPGLALVVHADQYHIEEESADGVVVLRQEPSALGSDDSQHRFYGLLCGAEWPGWAPTLEKEVTKVKSEDGDVAEQNKVARKRCECTVIAVPCNAEPSRDPIKIFPGHGRRLHS